MPVAVVREWVGHVDEQVLRLYTHVNNSASQEAMRALTQSNNRLAQTTETPAHSEAGSAQFQHTQKEGQNEHDAKASGS